MSLLRHLSKISPLTAAASYIRPPLHLLCRAKRNLSSLNQNPPPVNQLTRRPVSRFVRHHLAQIDDDCLTRHEAFVARTHPEDRVSMVPNMPWAVLSVDETNKLLFFIGGEQLWYPVWTPVPSLYPVTRCYGSCFGWLVMGDTMPVLPVNPNNQFDKPLDAEANLLRFFLLNPSTNQPIQLPPYPETYMYGFTKVILSSDPNDNNNDDHTVLVAIIVDSDVSFCRLGDEAWTSSGKEFLDIIFHKGLLYGLDMDSSNMVIIDDFDEEVRQHPYPLLLENLDLQDRLWYYLVESDGDLLLVSRESDLDHHQFCVFKLDFETRSCVKLTSLGDRSLLLDYACNASFDATNFSEFGFKPNRIYYTKEYEWNSTKKYKWHEFFLEDGKTVKFGLDFSTILPIPPIS